MNRLIRFLGLLIASLTSTVVFGGPVADEVGAAPIQKITEQIIRTVTSFANSISCPQVKVEPKMIAALVPYKFNDGSTVDAKYAVLWTGDIGCAGGSGTEITNLSIVKIITGAYIVDPLQSSPAIKFKIPARYVERIVGSTRDSLILEGRTYGSGDAICCPSALVHFTMRADVKGNWKLTNKQILPSKEIEVTQNSNRQE
jgi:hypothetical protein